MKHEKKKIFSKHLRVKNIKIRNKEATKCLKTFLYKGQTQLCLVENMIFVEIILNSN